MVSLSLRVLMVGLAPIALNACVEIEPATGAATPTAPLVGVDLGSSGRVPQIVALAGEGEGYGRTEPNPSPTVTASMPGMSHGSMDHGSMPGMHPAQAKMAAAHSSMPGMRHRPDSGDAQMAHSGHPQVQGTGTINAVDAASRTVNVSHGPIPTIGRPAMTMDFAVTPSVDLSAVKPGTRIKFEMEHAQDGSYVIRSIAAVGGRR